MNCGASRSQIANSTAGPGPIASRLSLGAGLSGDSLLSFFTHEKVLFVYPSRNRDVEKSHHHFVIGLFAPAHLNSARGDDVPFQFHGTIVFETRAYISYNLKFVY